MVFKKQKAIFRFPGVKIIILCLCFFINPLVLLAGENFDKDLFIDAKNIRINKTTPLRDESIKIYVTVTNSSDNDLTGVVKFFDEKVGLQIGNDQPVSLIAKGKDDVFVVFKSIDLGEHKIAIRLIPWENKGDNPNNNKVYTKVFVDIDTDKDGVPNREDTDDDNDGVQDSKDAFPLNALEQYDTDKDGKGNNEDTDDDNDGYKDDEDAFPLNVKEWKDSDGDRIGDNSDPDDDNDGLFDVEEEKKGTNPYVYDTDADGVNDNEDQFPLDPLKSRDHDQDGLADEEDDDDDNDGTLDKDDRFPFDANEVKDSDGDGIGDNEDRDDDNDGVENSEDAFPYDTNEWSDIDQDGLGDNADPDDYNQGPIPHFALKSETIIEKDITFDASLSIDPDGEISKYFWDFGDGKEDEGRIVKHKFIYPGTYNIILTIIDDKGEHRRFEKEILLKTSFWEKTWWWWGIAIIVILVILYTFTFRHPAPVLTYKKLEPTKRRKKPLVRKKTPEKSSKKSTKKEIIRIKLVENKPKKVGKAKGQKPKAKSQRSKAKSQKPKVKRQK